MVKPNEAWFDKIKVEGFEYADCPHGVLRRDSDEETDRYVTYICERCGAGLSARVD